MEKYKYGPLIYVSYTLNTNGVENGNESEGNYFWTGPPPVGYDDSGIPIDRDGNQCLDLSCPLHPAWEPTETIYNETLKSDIPSIEHFRKWFDNNFLIISDDKIKRYIIRWWSARASRDNYYAYSEILQNYSSVEEIQEAVWPDEPQS